MNFSMYQLARHPEIQEKARAEVLEKIAKHDGKFSYEALMEMEYLNQVFNGKLSQQSMTLDLKPNMLAFTFQRQCVFMLQFFC